MGFNCSLEQRRYRWFGLFFFGQDCGMHLKNALWVEVGRGEEVEMDICLYGMGRSSFRKQRGFSDAFCKWSYGLQERWSANTNGFRKSGTKWVCPAESLSLFPVCPPTFPLTCGSQGSGSCHRHRIMAAGSELPGAPSQFEVSGTPWDCLAPIP